MLGNPMNFHSDFLRILPLSLSITPLGSLSLRGAVLHSVVPARCRRSEEGAPSLVLLSIATADSPPSIDGRSSCLFPQRRWLHAPSSYPWQPSLAHAARILQNSPSSPTLTLVSLPSLVLQSSYWHPLFSLLDRFSLSVFRVANHISLVPIAAPSADARPDACHHVFRGLDGQQPRSSSGCSSSGLRVSSSSLMVLTLLTRAFRSSDAAQVQTLTTSLVTRPLREATLSVLAASLAACPVAQPVSWRPLPPSSSLCTQPAPLSPWEALLTVLDRIRLCTAPHTPRGPFKYLPSILPKPRNLPPLLSLPSPLTSLGVAPAPMVTLDLSLAPLLVPLVKTGPPRPARNPMTLLPATTVLWLSWAQFSDCHCRSRRSRCHRRSHHGHSQRSTWRLSLVHCRHRQQRAMGHWLRRSQARHHSVRAHSHYRRYLHKRSRQWQLSDMHHDDRSRWTSDDR